MCCVSGVARPPLEDATQMSPRYTNAICFPSGLSAGMRAPAIGSCVGGVNCAKTAPCANKTPTRFFQNVLMLSNRLFNHDLPEKKGPVAEISPANRRRLPQSHDLKETVLRCVKAFLHFVEAV